MENVTVKKSVMHGTGVFAHRDFAKGETILQIDDTHIVTDENALSEEDKNHCDYLVDKMVLMQSPEVYINHSCEPNTYTKTINGLRYVLAMRDIKNGEEITYDYVVNGYYEGANPPCNCGSKRCRGNINTDFFKLPLNLQKEYLPYLDEWFVEQFKDKISDIKSR